MLEYRNCVVSRPRPDRERILDVVQEGQSSKLGVSWRARLIVPTCNNSKHLAYMSVSRITGTEDTKRTGTLETRVDPLRSPSRLVKDGAETLVLVPSRIVDVGISYVVRRSSLFPSMYVRTSLVACSDSSGCSLSSLGCF